MNEILDMRNEIDMVDRQLVELFEKRMKLVMKIAEYKKQNDINVKDTKREEEVIQKCIEALENKNLEASVVQMMNMIMNISRQLQQELLEEQK